MTEEELNKLYTRFALQYESMLGTLVSKNLIYPDFVSGIRKDFYESFNEEKKKDLDHREHKRRCGPKSKWSSQTEAQSKRKRP